MNEAQWGTTTACRPLMLGTPYLLGTGGDEEMSAFNSAMTSGGWTCTVEESESTPIVEAGEPLVLEVRFIPILMDFNYMGGDHNMGASLGALDVVGLLTIVGESESAPTIDVGEAPLIPEQGGDDQRSALLGALESRGPLLWVGDNESTSVVEAGDLSIVQDPSYLSVHAHKCLMSFSARYAYEPLVLTMALQKGEHHTMDASLLATNTGARHNTEAETGGDEKPEAVVIEVDAGGSSTADAVGLPSVAIRNYLLRRMCTEDVELLHIVQK
ncbi:hypothetical protein Cgig2_024400 [Carnegiea gigantea]|uniref:Uncharacterized protein n=1 Tax=Carnegiea gigantea TaxID=171969 RepID=A0A9Q1GP44_9CARY|nr:hypothetical protein Cgig2_024400 [Carnegiea gigantea]